MKHVASVLGVQPRAMNNVNFRCFLKQFEPTSTHASLLQAGSRLKLYPSQNTPTTDYASMNTLGLQSIRLTIANLRFFLIATKYYLTIYQKSHLIPNKHLMSTLLP